MPAAAEAPPSQVTIVDTGPPSAPPAPTASIPATSIAPNAEPHAPPKPGSAMARMRDELRKKAKPAPSQETEIATPTETQAPPQGTPEEPGSSTPEPGSTSPAAPAEPQGQAKKVSPWKLVEQYKAKIAEFEKQVADAKTGALAEQQRREYLSNIEQLTKRNTELEDEIRYTNYAKSKEFSEKYQAPYEAAWKRAMSEMSEISVTDPGTGQARAVTADDLLTLVNLPLGRAREIADKAFGVFADDVMAHRKEIRQLFESQSAALAEAKEKGAEREKQRSELLAKQIRDTQDFVKKTWDQASELATKDERFARFFTPADGDQEGNQRLAKGFELVDRAFSENPLDPSLTAEQRAAVVKRHSAVRFRAAAFGRLTYMLSQAEKRLVDLQKQIDQFKGSAPTSGSAPTPPATPQPQSAREQVFGALRARAK